MTVKEYLNQFQKTSKEVKDVLGRIEMMKIMNKSEQELLDVEEDLYYLVIKYIDKIKEVSGLLDSVSDPLIYDIMHKRYIQGKKVKEIAEEMGFTERWVLELHREGLSCIKSL